MKINKNKIYIKLRLASNFASFAKKYLVLSYTFFFSQMASCEEGFRDFLQTRNLTIISHVVKIKGDKSPEFMSYMEQEIVLSLLGLYVFYPDGDISSELKKIYLKQGHVANQQFDVSKSISKFSKDLTSRPKRDSIIYLGLLGFSEPISEKVLEMAHNSQFQDFRAWVEEK